ncbi:MAG: DUF2796 domain-containing protein [Burkholderiaceae bacterium]|nr:DUF2796 domain-containing protein [Burkholderiaceae bacterium]
MLPAALLLAAVQVAAAEPHSHGNAKLDIAVEPTKISIAFESPLDNLLGFERAPRTDRERQQADAMVAKFQAAQALFQIDPAAQCQLARAELTSAALKLGQPSGKAEQAGHADIDGSFEFNCADAAKAAYIEHGLFQFARLQRLEVQLATPKGQSKRSLKRPAGRIALGSR